MSSRNGYGFVTENMVPRQRDLVVKPAGPFRKTCAVKNTNEQH